jgi:hypothetical protein
MGGSDARAPGAVPENGHQHEWRCRPDFPRRRFVAGIWRIEKEPVVLDACSTLPRSVRRELEDEAERLERFLAD